MLQCEGKYPTGWTDKKTYHDTNKKRKSAMCAENYQTIPLQTTMGVL